MTRSSPSPCRRGNAGRALIALLVLITAACGRHGSAYSAFTASHDAIRTGMSLREVFDAGLLDYMLTGEGANIIGRVGDIGQPASPECLIHTIDLHYGPGDLPHGLAGGFSIVAECVMDRAGFRELVPRAGFRATHDFLQALDGYARG